MAKDANERANEEAAELSDNVEVWKYNAIKRAILDVVPADEEGVEVSRLPEMVERRLSSDELVGIGSVEELVTIVREDLKMDGEVEPVARAEPERLRRQRE